MRGLDQGNPGLRLLSHLGERLIIMGLSLRFPGPTTLLQQPHTAEIFEEADGMTMTHLVGVIQFSAPIA